MVWLPRLLVTSRTEIPGPAEGPQAWRLPHFWPPPPLPLPLPHPSFPPSVWHCTLRARPWNQAFALRPPAFPPAKNLSLRALVKGVQTHLLVNHVNGMLYVFKTTFISTDMSATFTSLQVRQGSLQLWKMRLRDFEPLEQVSHKQELLKPQLFHPTMA